MSGMGGVGMLSRQEWGVCELSVRYGGLMTPMIKFSKKSVLGLSVSKSFFRFFKFFVFFWIFVFLWFCDADDKNLIKNILGLKV